MSRQDAGQEAHADIDVDQSLRIRSRKNQKRSNSRPKSVQTHGKSSVRSAYRGVANRALSQDSGLFEGLGSAERHVDSDFLNLQSPGRNENNESFSNLSSCRTGRKKSAARRILSSESESPQRDPTSGQKSTSGRISPESRDRRARSRIRKSIRRTEQMKRAIKGRQDDKYNGTYLFDEAQKDIFEEQDKMALFSQICQTVRQKVRLGPLLNRTESSKDDLKILEVSSSEEVPKPVFGPRGVDATFSRRELEGLQKMQQNQAEGRKREPRRASLTKFSKEHETHPKGNRIEISSNALGSEVVSRNISFTRESPLHAEKESRTFMTLSPISPIPKENESLQEQRRATSLPRQSPRIESSTTAT